METSFLSFGKNQKYYTLLRTIVDSIIGFVISWMMFGFSLWSESSYKILSFAIVIIGLSYVTILFGRKWLGIGALIGAVCTTIFFFIATRLLGL